MKLQSIFFFISSSLEHTVEYLKASEADGLPVDVWTVVAMEDGVEIDRTSDRWEMYGSAFLSAFS